jgi:hypothetical protein
VTISAQTRRRWIANDHGLLVAATMRDSPDQALQARFTPLSNLRVGAKMTGLAQVPLTVVSR